ncbi:MAG TPA: sugar ABC transporter permease [Ktedonobacteraceae bacterium]|nr:sugar ABC transporter permease [Ktedonobacteraceae bacterium]
MALSTRVETRPRQPEATVTRTRRRRKGWTRYSPRTFYLFVAPWVIGATLFTLFPMVYAFLVSLTNFDGSSSHWHWIGLQNYQELLVTSDTWYSLGQTLIYGVISVVLSVTLGLGLALLLNQRLRAMGLFRTIFYVPSIVPVVASAIMWRLIFDRDAGVLNALLEFVHLPVLTWLVDPTALYALIIMTLWGLGGGMIITLAGLQGVPAELLEAARMDGANKWEVFRYVTLPQISAVLFFQVITGAIAAFQTLVQPLLLAENNNVMSGVQVPRSTYLYMVDVYQQFFSFGRFGYGAAMLWVLFLIILGITILIFRSSSFWVYYEVDRDN